MRTSSRFLLTPLAAGLGRRNRLVVPAVAAAAAALTLAHMLYAGFGVWRDHPTIFDGIVYNVAIACSVLLCCARALLVRAERKALSVLAVAVAIWGLGNIYYTVELYGAEDPPYPSFADLCWLTFLPLSYVTIVLLARATVARLHKSVWLDGAIGALTVAALAAGFVVSPILENVGGTSAAVITNVAYPLGDLLLILFVVGFFGLMGWRPGGFWAGLGAAFVVFAVADTTYLYRVASGTFTPGTILDSLWLVGVVMLGLAAWQTPRRTSGSALEGVRALAAPIGFTAVSLGILLAAGLADVPPAATLLAGAALVAATARIAMTYHELRMLAETRQQALTDDLTGLPNRRLFYRTLEHDLDEARTGRRALALLLVDLDGFKELNDTLGHYAGDLLLQEIGPRLKSILRPGDLLARIGGDEFAVLLSGRDNAVAVARRICDALREPFLVDDISVVVDASIGIALHPDHADAAQTLLQRADVAMYQAKRERAGYRFYDLERDRHSKQRLELMSELRPAIAEGQLELEFQPIFDLQRGGVVAAEALVRWRHPRHGTLMPGTFLHLADQAGLMPALTGRVLDDALQAQRWWSVRGHDVPVCVNVAPTSLLDASFADEVRARCVGASVQPTVLRLEMTENALMADEARGRAVLEALRSIGIDVALDDFGVGYSSLGVLRGLPVSELKIDRSFIAGLAHEPADAAIVRSIVDLGGRLGLRVVAEGVEDAATVTLLDRLGVRYAQGYHLSRPLPAVELAALAASRNVRLTA